jgi:hypothetical protein
MLTHFFQHGGKRRNSGGDTDRSTHGEQGVWKIVFPRTLISFSKGLDSVAKQSMLAFHRVALGIVRRRRRVPNAKRGDNFRDKVTQELGTSVTVYLVTDSKARKDFCGQFVNYYLRVSSATREGFQPSGEAVRDC